MVEMQARRAQFVEAIELAHTTGRPLREVEAEVLGATHEQFGLELCKTWKFPASFQNVAGFHHHPQDLPEGSRTLASLVYIADRITKQLELGFTGDVESDEIDPAIKADLKLTQQDLDEIAAKLPEAIEEAQAIFGSAAVAA